MGSRGHRLVEFGANILGDPHVGTNRLIPIMEHMREHLRATAV